MPNTNTPLESKWSGVKLPKWVTDETRSVRNKMQSASKVACHLIEGQAPPAKAVRPPQAWTVRTELSRFNQLTGKMEAHFVIAECLGVTPADAIQNLISQLQSGAAQLK